jgi:hypothetical protein
VVDLGRFDCFHVHCAASVLGVFGGESGHEMVVLRVLRLVVGNGLRGTGQVQVRLELLSIWAAIDTLGHQLLNLLPSLISSFPTPRPLFLLILLGLLPTVSSFRLLPAIMRPPPLLIQRLVTQG